MFQPICDNARLLDYIFAKKIQVWRHTAQFLGVKTKSLSYPNAA